MYYSILFIFVCNNSFFIVNFWCLEGGLIAAFLKKQTMVNGTFIKESDL